MLDQLAYLLGLTADEMSRGGPQEADSGEPAAARRECACGDSSRDGPTVSRIPRLQLQLRDMAPEGLEIGGEDLGLLAKRGVWERLIVEVECSAVVLGMAGTCATTVT